MTLEDHTAVGLVLATTFTVAVLINYSGIPRQARALLYCALALRFVGAFARQSMAVDAQVYFKWGRIYAAYFSRFDLSPLFEPALFRHERWFGGNFVGYPTGLVITVFGPSWIGTFFAFGLISFGGLLAYAIAYRRSFPGSSFTAYWAWIFLMPSLWFWPSSIGKEALLTVGLGLATLGLAGRNERENWGLLVAGSALVFSVRPQVLAVFLLALVLSCWLRFRDWTPQRILQGLGILAVGLVGIWFCMSSTLGGEVELQTLEEYVETNASKDRGGSGIEGVGASPSSVPMAIANVLLRPFIWEAHNLATLVSAAEVLLIWGLVYYRRRELGAALRNWRQDRMLRFAVPFVALYVVALGMNLANLGIVARQRTLVFPLLFMIVEAGVYYRQAGATVVEIIDGQGKWSKYELLGWSTSENVGESAPA